MRPFPGRVGGAASRVVPRLPWGQRPCIRFYESGKCLAAGVTVPSKFSITTSKLPQTSDTKGPEQEKHDGDTHELCIEAIRRRQPGPLQRPTERSRGSEHQSARRHSGHDPPRWLAVKNPRVQATRSELLLRQSSQPRCTSSDRATTSCTPTKGRLTSRTCSSNRGAACS